MELPLDIVTVAESLKESGYKPVISANGTSVVQALTLKIRVMITRELSPVLTFLGATEWSTLKKKS